MEAQAPSEYQPEVNLGQEPNMPGDKLVRRRQAVGGIGTLKALQAMLLG